MIHTILPCERAAHVHLLAALAATLGVDGSKLYQEREITYAIYIEDRYGVCGFAALLKNQETGRWVSVLVRLVCEVTSDVENALVTQRFFKEVFEAYALLCPETSMVISDAQETLAMMQEVGWPLVMKDQVVGGDPELGSALLLLDETRKAGYRHRYTQQQAEYQEKNAAGSVVVHEERLFAFTKTRSHGRKQAGESAEKNKVLEMGGRRKILVVA